MKLKLVIPPDFQGRASFGLLFCSLIIWLLTILITVANCIFQVGKRKLSYHSYGKRETRLHH